MLCCLLSMIYLANGQKLCKIKFIVKDAQNQTPLVNSQIIENGQVIGSTLENGVFVTNTRKSGYYSFTIKRDNYEVWENYSINVNPDTTITTPPVYLFKLSALNSQFFRQLRRSNIAEAQSLYQRITNSYDNLSDSTNKKTFLLKVARATENKSVNF